MTFSKNRERLLEADAARVLLKEVVREARRRRLLSADHFTVDGTLLEAWASHKSYRPRDEQPPRGGGRNRDADPRSRRGQAFQGERRSRETHESTTDPEARLYRKGKQQGAQLCYLGHVLTENRNGLVVDVELTEADPWSSQGQAATPSARRRWRCWSAVACPRLERGSPRTNKAGAARSTVARPDIRGTAKASVGANGSKRSSAG